MIDKPKSSIWFIIRLFTKLLETNVYFPLDIQFNWLNQFLHFISLSFLFCFSICLLFICLWVLGGDVCVYIYVALKGFSETQAQMLLTTYSSRRLSVLNLYHINSFYINPWGNYPPNNRMDNPTCWDFKKLENNTQLLLSFYLFLIFLV